MLSDSYHDNMLSISLADPPRADPYTPVHKMQRARLFALTVAAGQIDPDDARARAALAGAIGELVDEISAHGHHEEDFVHPRLLTHSAHIVAALEADHVAIDARLDELKAAAALASRARPSDANSLYRSLAAFTSAYLVHLHREETEALPALWAHCTDADLAALFSEFHRSRSAATNLASLYAMAPTLNPVELRSMLASGLAGIGTHAVADVLATVLSPIQLGALRSTAEAGSHDAASDAA
jgi:hypothetical protein